MCIRDSREGLEGAGAIGCQRGSNDPRLDFGYLGGSKRPPTLVAEGLRGCELSNEHGFRLPPRTEAAVRFSDRGHSLQGGNGLRCDVHQWQMDVHDRLCFVWRNLHESRRKSVPLRGVWEALSGPQSLHKRGMRAVYLASPNVQRPLHRREVRHCELRSLRKFLHGRRNLLEGGLYEGAVEVIGAPPESSALSPGSNWRGGRLIRGSFGHDGVRVSGFSDGGRETHANLLMPSLPNRGIPSAWFRGSDRGGAQLEHCSRERSSRESLRQSYCRQRAPLPRLR